jgi:hypothetical protein
MRLWVLGCSRLKCTSPPGLVAVYIATGQVTSDRRRCPCQVGRARPWRRGGPSRPARTVRRAEPRASLAPPGLDLGGRGRRRIAQLGHEVVAPGGDVLAGDVVDQALEAPLALVEVHVQRPGQGVGNLFGAVGIDDQRLLHLPRGAGEARQDQHARILRRLRGDVLLGHQVHAVAQRRDQRGLGGAIDPGQLVAAIAAIEVADRVVVHVGIGAVDPADQAVQPPAQVLVGLDLVARDRGDLQQHHLAAGLGLSCRKRSKPISRSSSPLE